MKTFKESDNLDEMEIGDVFEQKSGLRHEAVLDNLLLDQTCNVCSLNGAFCGMDIFRFVPCDIDHFHFELQSK